MKVTVKTLMGDYDREAGAGVAVTSLRSHIADVYVERKSYKPTESQPPSKRFVGLALADALLADPTLAAIIDLAASHEQMFALAPLLELSPEMRALLAAWRASRAEQEPTP